MTPLSSADAAAAEAISKLIDQRGTDWLCDPRRCESILNDLLATLYDDEYGNGREGRLVINILAAAARCGVPSDLAKHRAGTANLSLKSMQTKWIKCLCSTEGKSEPLAERAIAIWAGALQVELGQEPKPPTPWWPRIAAAVAVALLLGAVAIVTTDAGQELRNRVVAWVWPKPPPPVAPRVTLVSVPTDSPHEPGAQIEVRVQFDRPVKVTGRPILPLRGGDMHIDATYDRGDESPELVFTFAVPRRDEEIVGIEFRPPAPARIMAAGGTIADLASGKEAALDLPATAALERVTLLAERRTPPPPPPPAPPAPQATAMRVASDRIYKSGDGVEISIAFSRPVTVTGRPRIRFTAGADPTERVARFQTSDGAALLTFVFDVPDGIESEGIDMGTNPSIDLAGGTVVDAANGTAARLDLRGSEPRNLAAVRIDSKPPRVRRVDLPQPRDYLPGEVLEFVVEFSEPVTIAGAPRLELRLGDAVRKTDSGVRPDGPRLAFRYTIQPGDPPTTGVEATTLLLEGGAIGDRADNQAELAFAVARSERVRIVRPQPPPLKDRLDVPLAEDHIIRLLLVEAGKQEIPEAMLQEWKQYAREYRMPTTLEITSPFYIGKTEVTLKDFVDVVGQPPNAGAAGGAVLPPPDAPQWQLPATPVRWDEAIQFCNALSQREGLKPRYRIDPAPAGGGEPRVTPLADGDGFRLPLPEEWVYACLTNQRLEAMTTGVSEWSDLRPGDTLPFAHGGYDALPKEQPPTFLMRHKRSDTPAYCGFRIVRSAGQSAPNP